MPLRQVLNVAYATLAAPLDEDGLLDLDRKLEAPPRGTGPAVAAPSGGADSLLALMRKPGG